MIPMEIGKQLFYISYMMCMMWLDCASLNLPTTGCGNGKWKEESLHYILTTLFIGSKFVEWNLETACRKVKKASKNSNFLSPFPQPRNGKFWACIV